jgi:hypothetical protein
MGLRRVAGRRSAPAAGQPTSGRDQVAPGGKAGSTRAAAQVRLVDLGNRIVRTATVDLEVGRDRLNDTINRATDVVTSAKGIYVGSSTSVPDGEPATGQVTIRVPVDAFEAVLRELKALGTYRGEQSSTEDVTTSTWTSAASWPPGGPRSGAWATAVNSLGVMAAAVLVGVGGTASAGRSVAPTTAARPRRSASPADPQAERMAGGVEVDADALLGLEAGEDRSGGDGAGAGGLQVVHLDVKVHLHPLVAGAGRPGRSDVGRLGLEGQPRPATGRAEGHPVGLVSAERPPQQLLVEAGQGARVGRVEHGGGQAHRRSLGHIASRIEPIPTSV